MDTRAFIFDSFPQVLTLLVVLGGGLVAYSQTLSCDDAITYHEFALNVSLCPFAAHQIS